MNDEVYIPFHWGDSAGIMFFANAFMMAHDAFEKYLVKELGMGWDEWFQNSDWIVPIKQTEANYLSPIRLGKNCIIELEIEGVRNSSFTVHYRINQDQVECCQLKTVHVFCDKKSGKKMGIPEKIKTVLNTVRDKEQTGWKGIIRMDRI